jgi:5'-phosphate synthase pdxT subunit
VNGSRGRLTVGVLALQGAFAAHQQRLADLGADAPAIRRPGDLAGIDALVLPGGESTTMSKLLSSTGLFDEIKALVSDGMPTFGTCAGMILLATEVLDGRPDQRSFGALDVTVRRNGYGRQIDSFEVDLDVDGLEPDPFHAVFIRAPVVTATGPGVATLAEHAGRPVVVAQGAIMAAAFHPELVTDGRLHRRFLDAFTRT